MTPKDIPDNISKAVDDDDVGAVNEGSGDDGEMEGMGHGGFPTIGSKPFPEAQDGVEGSKRRHIEDGKGAEQEKDDDGGADVG